MALIMSLARDAQTRLGLIAIKIPLDALVYGGVPMTNPAADQILQPPEGLTASEAAQRLQQDGPNVLASEQRRTWHMILRETLREPMFMLLLAAGTLYLTLGERQEGLVMFALVLVVLSLTLYQ